MEYEEVMVAKDDGKFEYVGKHSSSYSREQMPKNDKEYFGIWNLVRVYCVDRDIDNSNYSSLSVDMNKVTGDWLFHFYLGSSYVFRISDVVAFFYYNKMLFEVKYMVPHRSVLKINPLIYEYEISSITPYKKREEWNIPEDLREVKDTIMDYLPLSPELSKSINMNEVTQAVYEVLVSRMNRSIFTGLYSANPDRNIGYLDSINYSYSKVIVRCKEGL